MKNLLKKNTIKEEAFKILFGMSAVFSVLAVLSIIIFLLYRGFPAIQKIGFFDFIFGREWNSNRFDVFGEPITGKYGILPMIVGSLYATAGALLFGGTLGFFTGIFLAAFCPKRLKKVLTQIINLLAGIPSVIYGFFGMSVLLPLLGVYSPNGDGSGILAVSIVLGVMIMPTVTALTHTSVEAVDKSYFEGAIAIGARKEQAVFRVVVPAAKSGVFASIILGTGRAVGETMAVVMVSGGNTVFPESLFSSFRTMTANVVMEMSYAGELQMGALIATGVVLTVFILIINTGFSLLQRNGGNKKKAKRRGESDFLTGSSADAPVRAKRVYPRFARAFFPIAKTISRIVQTTFRAIMEFFRKAKRIFLVLRGGDLSERIQKNAAKPRGEIEYSVKGTIAVTGRYVSYAASAAGIFSLASIVVFVFINGVPHIDGQLLFGEFAFGGAPTIASSLLSTGMTIAAAAVLAFPLGIFTAIYLVEYTSKGNRLVKIIRPAVETLGGIPSIVYGLFGMILFCGIFKLGTSIIAGSLTISLMIIPTTVRAAEEALRAVPDTLREGSMALGGGRLRTIYRVVLPPALPGILAAVILGIGRIASESAPFLFTMGASLKPMPTGFKSAGTTLAVALYALSREGLYIKEAYATASVLILIILTLNVISTVLVNKLQKKLAGARREK